MHVLILSLLACICYKLLIQCSISGDGFPPPGDFSIPHSIAISETENLLCVADRENRRIQCFDLEGNFLHQMHAPDITGKVFAVSFNPITGQLKLIVFLLMMLLLLLLMMMMMMLFLEWFILS